MNAQNSSDVISVDDKSASYFENSASYQVDKMTFIVDRVFQQDGAESIGSILVKLIKSEVDSYAKCSNA